MTLALRPEVQTVVRYRKRRKNESDDIPSFGEGVVAAIDLSKEYYSQFGVPLTYRYREDEDQTYLGCVIRLRGGQRFMPTFKLFHHEMAPVQDSFYESVDAGFLEMDCRGAMRCDLFELSVGSLRKSRYNENQILSSGYTLRLISNNSPRLNCVTALSARFAQGTLRQLTSDYWRLMKLKTLTPL